MHAFTGDQDMSSGQFKPGDIVVLNSGCLPMTVERVIGDHVTAVWADKDNNIRRFTFIASALKAAPKS